ncbi:MAG: adenylate/guanylate cyclase domain-containing protein [Phycisphaerales bacterium]
MAADAASGLDASSPRSRLMALIFTDMVGSVDLKKKLGDCEFARMLSRHDELFRATIGVEADYVKDTGDGFLVTCASANRAVSAALSFQHALASERWTQPLRVRVGIHLGEVQQLAAEASGQAKLSGLAVDVAGRIMSLAEGGQILLTKSAFESARQYVRAHPPVMAGSFGGKREAPDLRWKAHGLYNFRGLDEPVEVYEVGAVGIAPLKQPPDSEKVKRACAMIGTATSAARGVGVRRLAGAMLVVALVGGAIGAYRHFGGAGPERALAKGESEANRAGSAPGDAATGDEPVLEIEPAGTRPPPAWMRGERAGAGAGGRRPMLGPGGREGPPPEGAFALPRIDPITGVAQVRMTPAKAAGKGARFSGPVLNREEYARLRQRIQPPAGVPAPTYDLSVDPKAVMELVREAIEVAGIRGFNVRVRLNDAGGAEGVVVIPPGEGPGRMAIERVRRIAEAFVLEDGLVELGPPEGPPGPPGRRESSAPRPAR